MTLALLRRFVERFEIRTSNGDRSVSDVSYAMRKALEDLEADASTIVGTEVRTEKLTWSPKTDVEEFKATLGPYTMVVGHIGRLRADKPQDWSFRVICVLAGAGGERPYEEAVVNCSGYDSKEAAMLRAEAYARRLIEAFDGRPVL